jgi:hypothetical protein
MCREESEAKAGEHEIHVAKKTRRDQGAHPDDILQEQDEGESILPRLLGLLGQVQRPSNQDLREQNTRELEGDQ